MAFIAPVLIGSGGNSALAGPCALISRMPGAFSLEPASPFPPEASTPHRPLANRHPTAHAVAVAEAMELAIERVHQAMDRVLAAFEAEHPELPLTAWEPPDRHPDPNQASATTRLRAEVACRRADSLCQQAIQASQQAKQVRQATRAVVAFLPRARQDRGPESFTRVSPKILVPSATRHGR